MNKNVKYHFALDLKKTLPLGTLCNVIQVIAENW